MDPSAAGPQVWVVTLVALPGVTYAAARGAVRGVIAEDDVSVGSRISQGLIARIAQHRRRSEPTADPWRQWLHHCMSDAESQED
jgi:hypothetical protein